MRIALISNDAELHKEIVKNDHFDVVITENLKGVGAFDVVIISDRIINYNELSIQFNTDTKEHQNRHLFYMLSNKYSYQAIDNIKSISKTINITIIPPKLSVSQIVNRVVEIVFPNISEKGKNIITFFGADSKVGTTMITQSTAEMLTKNTNAKIGLFFLNGNPSNHYLKQREKMGLDDIKIKLFNNILTSDELISACVTEDKALYVLSGVESMLDIRHYHPEHIDSLLKLASEKFNLILIDAGSNLDSGLAIASLNSTSNRYLVTTQQEVARRSYERSERQILNLLDINSNDFMLIVNKYIKSNGILNATKIADIYNMPLATFIPNLDTLGWQAEFDHKSLLDYGQEQYIKQIDQLAKVIASQAKLKYSNDSFKQNNFIKKAFSNLGGYL